MTRDTIGYVVCEYISFTMSSYYLPVVRVTPAKAAAAPTMAYTPGMMHLPWVARSSSHTENGHVSGYVRVRYCIIRPITRPVIAPIIKAGRKIPPGTRQPKVTIVRIILITKAVSRRYSKRGISVTVALKDHVHGVNWMDLFAFYDYLRA